MTRTIKTLNMLATILLAATMSPLSTAQTPPQTDAAAAQATPVAAASPAPAGADQTPAAESLLPPEEAVIFARKNGYRVAQVNGETMFCRRDRVTASRIRSEERCYTRAQLTRISEAARRLLDEQTNRMMQPREGG